MKTIITVILLALPYLGCAANVISTNYQSARITIDQNKISIPHFMGLGIQWDPYAYPPTPDAWKLTLKRLDYAHPAFVRVMFRAGIYCRGFNSTGTNELRYIYTEQMPEKEKQLGSLINILDYAQSRNIDVLLGEWSPPGRLGNSPTDIISQPDDPRWAEIITDFVTWLRIERGYSVIRMYNMMNEPNGGWMWPNGKVNYDAWASGIYHLRKEFDEHGLSKMQIVGPDNSGNWDWIDRVSKKMPECVDGWEMHWYASDREIFDGEIEKLLKAKRRVVFTNDTHAAWNRLFLAESGLRDGKCNGDQQPRVKTFTYGVLMADYVAQVVQAGWMGACAWDLDDAMHTVGDQQPPLVPNDKTLKVWGFWNTQGVAMGHPEDEDIRPWFYTWSLMSRLFPRDSHILAVRQPDLPHLRIIASTASDGRSLGVMLVNNADEASSVTVSIPGAGKKTVEEYFYFDKDEPTDADGLPVPKEIVPDCDLNLGIKIVIPSRGVIFLNAK